MSIAGGLFNTNNKKDDIGDTKSTADGEASAAQAPAVDLTTSIPGFDDDTDEGLLIETGREFGAVESDVEDDPDTTEQVRPDPEA